MGEMVNIVYSGFYDAPLAFVVRNKGRVLLFWREFSDDMDDYPDSYEVYLLPSTLSDEEIGRSWQELKPKAERPLGHLSVKDVVFDVTRRNSIDSDSIERIQAARAE